jgi:hypothetical protein
MEIRKLKKLMMIAAMLTMFVNMSYGGTILQFTQTNLSDSIRATDTNGVTTLSTSGNADGGGFSIPVNIQLGNTIIPGFETFLDVHNTSPATLVNNVILEAFTGTVAITSGINDTGINYLTATFTNVGLAGSLSGPNEGTGAALSSSEPPSILILTSDLMTITNPTSMAIGFTNINPVLSINGDGSIASFTAQNTGTFAGTTIPEPSSLMLWSIGILMVGIRFKKSL